MNDRFLKTFGMSLGAFLVLFAANGKAFTDALLGFPALVVAWTAALPLGVWSSLLALVVAMGGWAFAMKYLRPRPDGRAPQFAADLVSVFLGIAVTITQVIGQPAGTVLQAMWMGVAVGFLAPTICRGISSAFSRVKP